MDYGVLGTGILIMIAMGSVSILVMQVIYFNTNKRLNKIEKRQAKIEEGQAKLEEGQAKLEEGQAKLKDYVETRLLKVHDLLEKIMKTMGDLSEQLPKK